MEAPETSSVRTVDQNELRVNAFFAIAVLVTAFVSHRWEWVAWQAGALLLTTLHLGLGPYVVLYRHVLRPLGIVKPDVCPDNPEPHRFATLFGTGVASTAAYLLATGRSLPGWALVWVLLSLAAANLAGWCAGCFTYYMMNRLGFRMAFKHGPIKDTFPGARPPRA